MRVTPPCCFRLVLAALFALCAVSSVSAQPIDPREGSLGGYDPGGRPLAGPELEPGADGEQPPALPPSRPPAEGSQQEFDAEGRLIRDTDADGNVTTYEHDGATTTVRDPDGGIATHHYGPDGRLTSVTHPDGTTTTYDWEGEHRLTVTGSDGSRSRYEWDWETGQLITVEDADGVRTDYRYDLETGELLEEIRFVPGQEPVRTRHARADRSLPLAPVIGLGLCGTDGTTAAVGGLVAGLTGLGSSEGCRDDDERRDDRDRRRERRREKEHPRR